MLDFSNFKMTFAKNLPAFFMTDFQSSNEVLLVQKRIKKF